LIELRPKAVLLLAPLLLAAVLLGLWAAFFRDEGGSRNVIVHESGQEVARTTKSEALQRVRERVGFVPIVPAEFPIDGLTLTRVDSGLADEPSVDAPISSLWFVNREQTNPQELVVIAQSSMWHDALDNRRPIELEVPGVEAWALGGGLQRYLVRGSGMHVHLMVVTIHPVSDEDMAPALRSIAEQLQ
jgi:hypothetical protein